MADPPPNDDISTPRWVKVFWIIAIVVVLLFVILLLTRGPHRPGRHAPTGSGSGHTLPAGVHAPSGGLGGTP